MGARFSAYPSGPALGPSQPLGQGTSLPDVKRPRPGFDPPHHLTPRLKKEFSYTSAPPSEPSWPLLWCTLLLLKLLIVNIFIHNIKLKHYTGYIVIIFDVVHSYSK